jgi:hypothetical protein
LQSNSAFALNESQQNEGRIFTFNHHQHSKKGKMAGIFTIFEKKNPMNPEADANRNTGVKCTGDVTLKLSGREISIRCSVTCTDALAVSGDSTQVLTEHLSEGRIVCFGDFGLFQIGIGSNGAIKEEFFYRLIIKKRRFGLTRAVI